MSQNGLNRVRIDWNITGNNPLIASRLHYQRIGTNQIHTQSINWGQGYTEISELTGGVDYSFYLIHVASNPNKVKAAARLHMGMATFLLPCTRANIFPLSLQKVQEYPYLLPTPTLSILALLLFSRAM